VKKAATACASSHRVVSHWAVCHKLCWWALAVQLPLCQLYNLHGSYSVMFIYTFNNVLLLLYALAFAGDYYAWIFLEHNAMRSFSVKADLLRFLFGMFETTFWLIKAALLGEMPRNPSVTEARASLADTDVFQISKKHASLQKYHLSRTKTSLGQPCSKYIGPEICSDIPEKLKSLSPYSFGKQYKNVLLSRRNSCWFSLHIFIIFCNIFSAPFSLKPF